METVKTMQLSKLEISSDNTMVMIITIADDIIYYLFR